jgi:hypothetical protein
VDFIGLAQIGAQPSPSDVGPILVEVLERRGASKRTDLIAAVEAAWKEAGGPPISGVTDKVKVALRQLADQGIARQSGSVGIWELTNGDPIPATAEPTPEMAEEGAPATESAAELELGAGRQLVYCFYLGIYRHEAQSRGEDRWPIKIGMTTGPLDGRMATLKTALPDEPRLAVLIRADNAALLEKVLQGVLTLRGYKHDVSGGDEWFLTNPEEIVDLYRLVAGNYLDSN